VLSDVETQACLHANRWGTLATAMDGQPYAVPLIYGYDERCIYAATRPGRKTRNLEANPAVCFTVTEAPAPGRWRSVIIIGRARLVTDLAGRLQALRALSRSAVTGRDPGAEVVSEADLPRLDGAAVIRIEPDAVTGRAVGW
jgi:nitroimidazol reductase NimA-like FMN-containing flavoprotein (pyridoxamine 5'-phosphate oxidase superfamily)